MAARRHPLGLTALPRRAAGAALLVGALALAPLASARDTGFAELPGWDVDRLGEALPAFRAGCSIIAALPPATQLGGEGVTAATAADFALPCAEAAALPADEAEARAFLERHFRPVAAGEGVLTGYFEPELRGSPVRDARYRTPLHARPPELVEADLGTFAPDLRGRRVAGIVRDGRLQPFQDRAAIAAGALGGRGLELLWVDDPVDAFFLHIQGSGRVAMPDGRVVRIGYAGWNGHPYFAVGRALVERGAMPLEAVSMQAIRAWMAAAGPSETAALMALNPSYIFFRILPELPPEAGPPGTLGAPLTPMRSVAVDRTRTALGLPVWIAAEGDGLRRLAVAQDTGGAIRGAARIDLFTGWGEDAAERAGRLRQPARVFVLVPITRAGDGAQAPAAVP